MATRTITGTIRKPDGTAWAGAQITFTPHQRTYTADAVIPVEAVAVTATDGTFSVDLEADLATAWSITYPDGSTTYRTVITNGPPITLSELLAVDGIPTPISNDVQTALDAGFALFSEQLEEIAATTVGASAYEIAVLEGFEGTESEWLESLVGPQGEQGIQGDSITGPEGPVGPPPTLAIGAVTEGDADATITGSDGAYTLDLVIPKGDQGIQGIQGEQGETGPANSLSIGTVTTGAAAASITGDAPAQTLNLVLPPGNVPTGGTYGQTVTKTDDADYAMAWRDVPGIVYPSLLLSPDGSFDQNGAVSPTITGTVPTAAGEYGNGWIVTDVTTGRVSYSSVGISRSQGTLFVRARMAASDGNARVPVIIGNHGGGVRAIGVYKHSTNALRAYRDSGTSGDLRSITEDTPVVLAITWNAGRSDVVILAGGVPTRRALTFTPIAGTDWSGNVINVGYGRTGTSTWEWGKLVESVLIFPVALPESEIARIAAMTSAWSMANAAANLYQPASSFALFTPNKKIIAGGTTLRTAPGAATQQIATLVAAALVEDSGRIVSASSVNYSLVNTSSAGLGWIPTSALEAI